MRDAQLFQTFPESIPASLCSLSSVLGGLLPFKCVLTVLAPKQGSCSGRDYKDDWAQIVGNDLLPETLSHSEGLSGEQST